jgi:uncharacterized damage-inducible protein DinB
MADFSTLLEEALEAWAYTRAGVADELRGIPEAELDFKPSPQSRSIAELVQHVIASGLMMAGELARSDGDFQRKSYEGFLHEYARGVGALRSRGNLLERLRATHAEGDKRFRRAGELHMLQNIRRFDGKLGTRLAWLNHGISHEEYHRGQLAMYARLLGRVPALTKKIQGG